MKAVHAGQSYQALWWVARTMTIACLVLFLVTVSEAALIYALLPLKEIRPMLVSSDLKNNQVVQVEPLEKGTKGLDLLMETLARHYVELRETFDFQTEVARWQKLSQFSSAELGEAFQYQMQKAGSPFEQFKQRGITRSIHIINSAHLAPSAPNVWQVDWESCDRDPKTGVEVRAQWVSTLTAECQERVVRAEDQYINPMGFTVIQYTVSSKSRSSL